MILPDIQETPPIIKQSHTKIFVRVVILLIFGTIFGIALFKDIASGEFDWLWGLAVCVFCAAIGFRMSRLVPMQVHEASQCITLSFDSIYFAVILFLVIAKVITGQVLGMIIWTDITMCVILGLMGGRIIGICFRVRQLKIEHNFIAQ